MTLRILPEAEQEALAAATWYEHKLLGLGDDFVATYAAALEAIEKEPLRYPRLETIRSRRNIRRCILRRFPYMVIFEVLPQETVALAVAHTSRRPNYWRGRRP